MYVWVADLDCSVCDIEHNKGGIMTDLYCPLHKGTKCIGEYCMLWDGVRVSDCLLRLLLLKLLYPPTIEKSNQNVVASQQDVWTVEVHTQSELEKDL